MTAYGPVGSSPCRLARWHGAPGTGKTTAVRTLLHAWRGWADGVVVTDPDALLQTAADASSSSRTRKHC